jgi:chorismate mutase/prephenate dehydratase
MASADELLEAAETVLSKGNQQVILCESGIRTFNEALKPTLDLAGVVKIKSLSHLPIIVNTSYACDAIGAPIQALAAKRLKADGLILSLTEESMSLDEQLLIASQCLGEIYRE